MVLSLPRTIFLVLHTINGIKEKCYFIASRNAFCAVVTYTTTEALWKGNHISKLSLMPHKKIKKGHFSLTDNSVD